ncbi:Tim10/DDP family zinc finger-domain-containing protein [Mrakia frigida]|uniref:protein translocase subunit TIM13 n=1 Tax=Mrakia frigida TaxID=29902 RepID=UPI003FCC1986
MASLFGGSSATKQAQPSQEVRKEQIMEQVKQELQLASAQELINKMNEKCFEKCVPKPGALLTRAEESCVTMCMERYMEAFNVVSKSYVTRLTKERGQLGSAGGGMLGGEAPSAL